jgi:hypothetical protein
MTIRRVLDGPINSYDMILFFSSHFLINKDARKIKFILLDP